MITADADEVSEATQFPVSPPVAEFYGVELTEDDILEAAEILENAVPGLGDWYLGVDPDCEIQRDLQVLGRLFWQRRKAPCECKKSVAYPSKSRVSSSRKPIRETVLRYHRESLGLDVAKLAELAGVHTATVYRLENGHFQDASRIWRKTRRGLEPVCGKPLRELLEPIEQSIDSGTVTPGVGTIK